MQSPKAPSRFPGQKADGSSKAISDIPINMPLRFVGRDKDLAAIDVALESKNGRAAITALHGLRGVAKTVERGCTQSSLRMRRTGAIAARVEITVWSKEVGADFLIARTGRTKELDAALSLSELLGGLPLAHEQAAAYCERTGCGIASYASKFAVAPERSWMIQRPHPNNITTD